MNLSVYDHPLFETVSEIAERLDELTFKEASTLIGSSLIDDFSEIDSQDAQSNEYRDYRRYNLTGLPMDRNLKTPFLSPIATEKEYVLVLDLDETLLHFND